MRIGLTDELRALGICENDLPEEMSLEEARRRLALLRVGLPSSNPALTDDEIDQQANLGWRAESEDLRPTK